MTASLLYPFILATGVLQALGNSMNARLRDRLLGAAVMIAGIVLISVTQLSGPPDAASCGPPTDVEDPHLDVRDASLCEFDCPNADVRTVRRKALPGWCVPCSRYTSTP